jgi:hypothetical protein
MKLAVLRVLLTGFVVNIFTGIPIGMLIGFFPTMPSWIIFTIPMITILPLCYFLYTKFFDKDVLDGQQQNFIQRNKISIGIGVFFAAIISGFSNLRSLDVDLVVDNGTVKTAKIEYYNRTKDFVSVEIPSDSFQTITIPVGENTITVNGKKKLFNMGPRGWRYIYNIDKINNYKLFEIEYGNDAGFPRELENYFSTEFFKVSVDYLFDAPETVLSKRGRIEKKTVLMRFNNTNKQAEDQAK